MTVHRAAPSLLDRSEKRSVWAPFSKVNGATMCSKSIPILRKTSYDFSFLSSSGTETIVLIPAIDVASYYRACLFIRVHNSQMSAGQLIQFEIDNTLPSDEDPAEFIERTGIASPVPLATLDIDDSNTAPALVSTNVTELGAALRVRFIATQGGSSGTPFFVELSSILILRDF